MRRAHNRLGFDHRPTSGSYRAAHTWVNTHYPRSGRCEWCAGTGRWTEYATAQPGRYTRNRADWLELCRRCHKHFDGCSEANRAGKAAAARERKGVRRSPQGRANIAAANRRRAKAAALGMLVLSLVIAGCGGGSKHRGVPYKPLPRPPLTSALHAPAASCAHAMGDCLPHPALSASRRPLAAVGGITGPDFSNNDPVYAKSAWSAIAAHNRFVYLKSWEGSGYFDPTAKPMAALAKAAHLPVGGYDFQHVCGTSASAEAIHFVNALRAQGLLGPGTLPPAGDSEYGSGSCGGRAWMNTWVATVYANDGHICPIDYTGAWWWQPNLGSYWPTCQGHQLKSWVSGYGVSWPYLPSGLAHLDIWQFADNGFNGHNNADLSAWKNGEAAFRAFASQVPPPDPYALYDRTVRRFPGGVRASEVDAVSTWDRRGCRNPVLRPVCRTDRAHLVLLRDRLFAVHRHGGWGPYHRGARFQGLQRRLQQK